MARELVADVRRLLAADFLVRRLLVMRSHPAYEVGKDECPGAGSGQDSSEGASPHTHHVDREGSEEPPYQRLQEHWGK